MNDDDSAFSRLPDPSDDATKREEQFLAAAIEKAKNTKPLEATGQCRFSRCGEEVEEGLRFCGPACRDGYELEQRMKTINGRSV